MHPKSLFWILLKFKKNNFSQSYAFGGCCFFLISYNIHEKEEIAHPGQNKEGQRAQNMGT